MDQAPPLESLSREAESDRIHVNSLVVRMARESRFDSVLSSDCTDRRDGMPMEREKGQSPERE